MPIMLPGGGTPSWAKWYSFNQGDGGGGTPGLTPPPPPPPPPSAPSAPGVTAPDYNSILMNNPYVLQAQALAEEQLAALRSQIGSSASRAIINLGDAGIAHGLDNLFVEKNIDEDVQNANDAGTSILAQLGHQHEQNTQAIPANLAGRGFYRSGQLGYGLGEEARGYGLQQEKARSSTLDYLNQLASQYLTGQFQAQQAENAALMQAYNQAQSMMAYYANAGGAQQQPSAPIGADAAVPTGGLSLPALKLALGYGTSQPWTAGL